MCSFQEYNGFMILGGVLHIQVVKNSLRMLDPGPFRDTASLQEGQRRQRFIMKLFLPDIRCSLLTSWRWCPTTSVVAAEDENL